MYSSQFFLEIIDFQQHIFLLSFDDFLLKITPFFIVSIKTEGGRVAEKHLFREKFDFNAPKIHFFLIF